MAFDRSPQKVVYRLSLRALPSFRLPRERYYYRYREPPLSQPSARFRRYIRRSCCARDSSRTTDAKMNNLNYTIYSKKVNIFLKKTLFFAIFLHFNRIFCCQSRFFSKILAFPRSHIPVFRFVPISNAQPWRICIKAP